MISVFLLDQNRVSLSKKEIARYSRQLMLSEIGLAGQLKLKNAKVLVVGVGGLGAPLLQYLTAVGVGTIGIVDFDLIEESNLHRQVLFTYADIGQSKVDVAKNRLLSQNSTIKIIAHDTKFTSQNAFQIASGYDVIADGTDNFPTRYLVNDVSVLLKIPNVYAAISKFSGQLSVFNFTNDKGEIGPNYRDLFPEPPSIGSVKSCAEGGVLGVLPGILGSLQANEVIKIITGIGKNLSGRLFFMDALNFETRILRLQKDPNNPLTGKNPTVTNLIEYDEFCGISHKHLAGEKDDENSVKNINVYTLKKWFETSKNIQLIDVRDAAEYNIVNLNGKLIPPKELLSNKDLISTNCEVVIHCQSGKRSADIIQLLQKQFGFTNLYNLKGGILEWVDKIDNNLAKY